MSIKYVRDHYHVPAKRGGRVRYIGSPGKEPKLGTITGGSNYLHVRFDGEKHSVNLHPTWRLEYLDVDGYVMWRHQDIYAETPVSGAE